jgi:putative ABC transport system permease protein
MIQNYLKVASRNIVKRKLYSFINAFGLSVGIAFCVLIYLFIIDEQSFDQFHVNKSRLFRLEANSFDTWQPKPDKQISRNAWLQTAIQPVIKDEVPEIEYVTRFNDDDGAIFRYDGKVFTEKVTYVDADFFKMFSFKLRSGNPDKLFKDKSEVVLTPAVVKKYFGESDPIGKIISIDHEGEKNFTVTGVIDPPPANSSLDFQILLLQDNRPGYARNVEQWGNFNSPTFFQITPNADMKSLDANLAKFTEKFMGEKVARWRKESPVPVPEGVKMFEYVYSPFESIHLHKEVSWHKGSDPQYSLILGGIAALILIIACINYVSLALTTSTSRRTEVGIRKAVGAQKKQLVWQFSFESLMLALISMVIGIILVVLFLPAFNEFTGKGIELGFQNVVTLIVASVVITIVVGLLAGSYPAMFLSGFRPALVLKGRFSSKLQAGFTKPLVILQFVLSAFLIISSVIMYRQMRFITTKDLGFDQEQILVIPTQTGWNAEADKTIAQFRSRMEQEPSVVSVAGTTASFNRGWSRYGYKVNGEQKSAFVYGIDPEYISTLGLQLAMGRNFDASIASDTSAVIVNEALVKDMKWTDPLNEHLNWKEDTLGMGAKVIGVIKDYHFQSLERKIEPLFLSMDKSSVGNLTTMLVKTAAGDLPTSLSKIESAWRSMYPDRPFDYSFLDEDVANQYQSYKRWMNIMGLSTGFAILISCLGLFGLAGINAVNRTKEIGIRKVMGAELSNIFVLLNRQYIWLSLISFAIAAPLSWYVMTEWWLKDFQFKVTIGWELFAFSMLSGLFVALLTVSYHAIRAALTNPAETLKYE